ncbi:uncharacterized protein L3040_003666 [Drepanopeziza brunnea f. sp. 'multigermtubi']|uniref:uncharacterized protein n=1 Tax=Drepanopeziza brunnea f. sp. 'multigermtubi' TaxID=698441 RepID=UPI002383BFED|nr:hypothetical protein L3040_003666 [Drepanopeziza brunnea f. sp. 'multigermtubi']
MAHELASVPVVPRILLDHSKTPPTTMDTIIALMVTLWWIRLNLIPPSRMHPIFRKVLCSEEFLESLVSLSGIRVIRSLSLGEPIKSAIRPLPFLPVYNAVHTHFS